LLYTAAFQLVDAVQIICVGSLRGYNDTLFISVASFGGYWCLGLPLGFVLARTDLLVPQMGAAGFWTAFVICLSLLAVVFLWRLRRLHRLGPQAVRRLIER
jgi:MATE family multidrug resistance protein